MKASDLMKLHTIPLQGKGTPVYPFLTLHFNGSINITQKLHTESYQNMILIKKIGSVMAERPNLWSSDQRSLATDPEVRFPVLPDFLSSGSVRGPLSLVSTIEELFRIVVAPV
jgi:hypothetical protein